MNLEEETERRYLFLFLAVKITLLLNRKAAGGICGSKENEKKERERKGD